MKKDREFYTLVEKGHPVVIGQGTGPFSRLENAIQWIHASGIKKNKIDLYKCEIFDDGSKMWSIQEC